MDPIQSVINSISILDDELITGKGDYNIQKWNLKSRKFLFSHEIGWEVRKTEIFQDTLFVGSLDGKIRMFDVDTFEFKNELIHEKGITALFVDDLFLVSGSYNGSVQIRDSQSLEIISELSATNDWINTVTSDEIHLYLGDGFRRNSQIDIYHKKEIEKVRELKVPESKKISAIELTDNLLFVGHCYPHQLVIWDVLSFEIINIINVFDKEIVSIFSNRRYVYVVSKNQILQIEKSSLAVVNIVYIKEGSLITATGNKDEIFVAQRDKVLCYDSKKLELKYRIFT